MKTFALVQGDLSPAPGGYLIYEGANKIFQDLSLALREEYGTDPFHPRWGSVLQRFVGLPMTPELKAKVLSEIQRVLNNYITVQNARIVKDTATSSRSSLSTSDIVTSVSTATAQQIFDALIVRVTLQTLSGQQVTINQVMT